MMLKILYVPLMLLTLIACATKPDQPPLSKDVLIKPMVTVEQTTCQVGPMVPPNPVTNEGYQTYLEAVRLAGEDCRSHLSALKQYLDNLDHIPKE